MALLERVGTLLRANLNDLIDRAEDPEKMIKQVILDMENQLMQVKTQVAISIADLHLLERKRDGKHAEAAEWMRKAELAVAKQQDDLARAAIERSLETRRSWPRASTSRSPIRRSQVENLKTRPAQAGRQTGRGAGEERSADREAPPGSRGRQSGGSALDIDSQLPPPPHGTA